MIYKDKTVGKYKNFLIRDIHPKEWEAFQLKLKHKNRSLAETFRAFIKAIVIDELKIKEDDLFIKFYVSKKKSKVL